MTFSTVIPIEKLVRLLGDPDCAIIDCRFDLDDLEWGRKEYFQAHIPGALYAHLDEDLCSQVVKGKTGRHPLPSPEILAEKFNTWGIDDTVHVVAYDAAGGSMAAARLWWLLRWLGHVAVAVLDGGWDGWVKAMMPVSAGIESRLERKFLPRVNSDLIVVADELRSDRSGSGLRIIDVRAPERYRGDVEPIDPIAGHIPGAINAPYSENLDSSGFFLPPELLRERYTNLLMGEPAREAVFYCGSGVTAAHSLLAMVHAGLGDGCLYPGSWSEWITDPKRPIEIG